MVKRIRIGLIYIKDKNWIAGTYYIQNLVNALNRLPDKSKPALKIFSTTKKEFIELKCLTNYPYLHFFPIRKSNPLVTRIINKTSRVLSGKNLLKRRYDPNVCDLIFPNFKWELSLIKKKLYWIPDFQEEYLPDFFSGEDILNRKKHQKNLSIEGNYIVFSSKDALKDYNSLYPNSKANTYILPFAVTHPDYKEISIERLLKKYTLPKDYFFAPNQFWAHKNQGIILFAISILKKRGQNIFVAFSGKEYDHRNPDYFPKLKEKVVQLKIENNVKFLGFIDRKEQLQLMNYSKAIIQPSLFEGWSTVVEDAKALNQIVIASKLRVHQEQLDLWKGTKVFFDEKDSYDLSDKIIASLSLKRTRDDYEQSIIKFGQKFMEIVNDVIKKSVMLIIILI